MVTPGNTAPEASFTMPAIAPCAEAMAGIKTAHASSVRSFANLPMGGSFDWLQKGNRV
jgi:hypothetical protein